MGYGYQPLRYVFFLVFPVIILFAIVWYFKYYALVLKVVSPNFESILIPNRTRNVEFPTVDKKLFGKTLIKVYNHQGIKPKINFLVKIRHVVFFSASVLLSIRFKKDWIVYASPNVFGRDSFLTLVTVQWSIGILLYVVFGVLI